MGYQWGNRSKSRLGECHPLLQELFDRVIAHPDLPHDLTVLCGHRGEEAQNAAYASGASTLRWPRSKHNKKPSMAVDVAPYVDGGPSWDWAHYHAIAPIVKTVWSEMGADGLTEGLKLQWGGDWASFKDGPHWELKSTS